jgi:nanoRNase/pAp phosphatase (c-di-AMP/oligoRNAs hydrolase)
LFGGGGHARAAGAKFEQPALIVRERLLSEIVPRLV